MEINACLVKGVEIETARVLQIAFVQESRMRSQLSQRPFDGSLHFCRSSHDTRVEQAMSSLLGAYSDSEEEEEDQVEIILGRPLGFNQSFIQKLSPDEAWPTVHVCCSSGGHRRPNVGFPVPIWIETVRQLPRSQQGTCGGAGWT